MTRKKLVKQLKQDMPQFTGSKEEVEQKIAMYIYLKLGESKEFDEKFFLSSKEEKEKIIKAEKFTKYHINSAVNKKNLTCYTISNLYKALLKDFGIKCKTQKMAPTSNHYYNIITLCDDSKILVDIQRDLSNIKTKSKTQFFGMQDADNKISDEKLFELHKECGYVEKMSDYMDFKIERLAQELKGLPVDERLVRILNDEEINKYKEKMGYIEFYSYYTKLISKIIPKEDQELVSYFNCYRIKEGTKGKRKREYAMCIYSICNDKVNAYMYSKADKKFKNVDLKTFDKLERQGLFLGSSPTEKNAQKFREYLNRAILNRYQSKNDSDRMENK